ncbi:hypothetical protein G3M48_009275 [Beauveria asiatica]|uniref:Uncharacterized protein n=1 Tax=Beauveria asiatica TaxID=1069075 RepID=A0AAW0RJC5_9HYPO
MSSRHQARHCPGYQSPSTPQPLSFFSILPLHPAADLAPRRYRVPHEHPAHEHDILWQQGHERKRQRRPRQRVPRARRLAAAAAALPRDLEQPVRGAHRQQRKSSQRRGQHPAAARKQRRCAVASRKVKNPELRRGEQQQLEGKDGVAGEGEGAAEMSVDGGGAAAADEEQDGDEEQKAEGLDEVRVGGLGGVVVLYAACRQYF